MLDMNYSVYYGKKAIMMVAMLFLVGTIASATSEETNNNALSMLRRGRTAMMHDKVKAASDTVIRVIVKCKPSLADEECVEKLKGYDHETLQIVHKLPTGWAVAIGESDEITMMALEETFDVFGEAIRKPMYIPESVVIEEHRHLQFWKRQEVPYGIDMVKAPEAWETYSQINQGAGVKVCVMDTGLDQDHEDFIRSNLSGYTGREAFTPWNQDREGHGTHVSGTIAAADNDEGVVGVAPLAEIYMVRVFDNEGDFMDLMSWLRPKRVGMRVPRLFPGV
eukprot:scaffold9279_cov68-Cylindrotheca_fusiformis.AAC.2